MNYSPLLAPVVALVAWTLVIMVWMVVARFAAFKKMGVSLGKVPAGARGVDMDGKAPNEAQWKSHNYNHLMEQPTIYYAIVITLALMGMDQPVNIWLAWGYVGLRVIHSLIQCTVNVVRYRLLVFGLATFCLLGLTVHAAARVAHDCLGW
ncbi:MAPEG family protein [Sphingomonas sp. G124]|uniref:MAPEG family protein n=1 Tax=Sphingomonas cremea TaxID=2904799 RepID=A0A9X1TXU1_9SPHN|nr:MAPEG family protein [Sphingomonas cremea]MCF2514177.1 MAPEG family protein [Sphingomonas cremea]